MIVYPFLLMDKGQCHEIYRGMFDEYSVIIPSCITLLFMKLAGFLFNGF